MAELLPALLGVAVGLVLGLTGAGGSILAVPLLMWGLHWTLPQAAPIALLAVFGAAAFGTLAAWDAAFVRYRAALLMGAASLLTAPLGLAAARALPLRVLLPLFGALMLLVALRLWLQAQRRPEEARVVRATVAGEGPPARGHLCELNARGRIVWTPRAAAAIAAIGALTGFVSGLFGVGGGFVIVPALRALTPLSMHSAVATSLMAIALIAAGTFLIAQVGGVPTDWAAAAPFAAGALAGMLGGRGLARRLAGPALQRGFALLMTVVAVRLLLQSF